MSDRDVQGDGEQHVCFDPCLCAFKRLLRVRVELDDAHDAKCEPCSVSVHAGVCRP